MHAVIHRKSNSLLGLSIFLPNFKVNKHVYIFIFYLYDTSVSFSSVKIMDPSKFSTFIFVSFFFFRMFVFIPFVVLLTDCCKTVEWPVKWVSWQTLNRLTTNLNLVQITIIW